MSRYKDLGKILKRLEGREYEGGRDLPIEIQEIRKRLSEGYEDHYRAGLLVGKKLDDGSLAITDVIVPEQDSHIIRTMVLDWESAVHEAESKGLLVGSAFYVGKKEPEFTVATIKTHENLCKRYGIEDFSVALNKNDKYQCKKNSLK